MTKVQPVADTDRTCPVGLGTGARSAANRVLTFGTVVRHASSDAEWHYPSEELPRYRVQELAGSRKVPVNGMAVQPLESSPAASDGLLDLATSSHEFAYNYGDEPVNLYWRGSKEIRCVVVAPGDSYYMKPTKPHAVRALEGGAASVLMVRVGGALTGDSASELASLPETALDRVISETRQWYDPKGRAG